MTLTPMLDVLPDAQRALWPALGDLPDSLVLYGGTALALRLGHRSSVDFDFFSSEPLDVDALFELSCFAGAEILQREPDTLTVSTRPSGRSQPVKVSFFGGVDTGRVGDPQRTDDGVVLVASLLDLFGKAVDRALSEFVRRARAGRILLLAGSGLWEGDLAEMRSDRSQPPRPADRGTRRASG